MKKSLVVVLAVMAVMFSGAVLAKQDKSTILHCGCTWDGLEAGMAYEEINISSKSRGHDGHLATTVDSCYTGDVEVEPLVFEPTFSDFVRNGDDCQLDGPPLGDPIADCPELDGPVAGDACGVELLIQ
jgi:hypothetical protein